MSFTPILAFAVIAATFAVGDFIALKTRGIVSTFITAIIVFLTFGSILKVLPENLMDISGLSTVIPTFGMALILTNLGASLDLNDLMKEWKTVVVSLAAVIGIVVISFSVGQLIFGREYALSSIAPITGGIVAAMISSDAAIAAGNTEIASYIASIMALDIIIGLPLASYCLRKAIKKYISKEEYKNSQGKSKYHINIKFLPDMPKSLDIQTMHFARLAFVASVAQFFSEITGINTTLSYLLIGSLSSAIGVLEKNSLRKSGGEGILLLATYAYVSVSFLSMTITQFSNMILPIFGMLLLGALGIGIFAIIVGLIFKWDAYLSFGVGLACFFGYPTTYAVSMEVVNGVLQEESFQEKEVENLTNYILPKMVISGVVSVSVVSVIIAEIISPMIF